MSVIRQACFCHKPQSLLCYCLLRGRKSFPLTLLEKSSAAKRCKNFRFAKPAIMKPYKDMPGFPLSTAKIPYIHFPLASSAIDVANAMEQVPKAGNDLKSFGEKAGLAVRF